MFKPVFGKISDADKERFENEIRYLPSGCVAMFNCEVKPYVFIDKERVVASMGEKDSTMAALVSLVIHEFLHAFQYFIICRGDSKKYSKFHDKEKWPTIIAASVQWFLNFSDGKKPLRSYVNEFLAINRKLENDIRGV